ncbi:MAG: 1-acyl-sn-glycerol-3-phosphate acyltransferase [Candidatus Aldehydirespiratoraceae bacterium]|jgi:1-acyl-sn-glycerol-3-phosphate acyltransferase
MPRPVIRRTISVAAFFLAATLLVAASPIVLPLLALRDLSTGRGPLRRVRFWCVVTGVVIIECAGVLAAAVLTAAQLGRNNSLRAQSRFHRLEWWWAGTHLRNLRRFAGLRWVVENPESLLTGNAIVLARHASHADAILPVLLFGIEGGHPLRYTLKDDLQWAPAMDIVGNRLPNVFLHRSPSPDSPLWDRLRTLSNHLGDDVAVIFPEGTFFTPERLDRAATRIGETRPDLEPAVRTLKHMLPPRPAGTRLLLQGAPDADLILVAHEGMGVFGDLAAIRSSLPLSAPVQVRVWRINRSEVPEDEHAFTEWLVDRWIDMDRWIEKRMIERHSSGGYPPSLVGAKELP